MVLGVSFCLSVMMMITALTRLCGIRASTGVMDITWDSFWHLAEGCIAVTMVSSTAFREFWVAHRSHTRRNANMPYVRGQKPWKEETFGVERDANEVKDMKALPELPQSALAGRNTFLGSDSTKGKGYVFRDTTLDEDPWPLPATTANTRFEIQRRNSLEAEMVRTQTFLDPERLAVREQTPPSHSQRYEYQNYF